MPDLQLVLYFVFIALQYPTFFQLWLYFSRVKIAVCRWGCIPHFPLDPPL